MFPYGSPDAASALIETGWRTSFNAASLVLDCFARPPRDARVRPSRLRELIAEWNARGHHPCKRQLVRCATAILENSRLSLRESIAVIGNLTLNAPSTAALSIAHAASGLGSLG
jgi:hypothetical protein